MATKTKAKQKLGPRQNKWLKKLESGRLGQCRSALFNGKGYCCLGVACVVKGMKARRNRVGKFEFASEGAFLPKSAQKHFAFTENNGRINKELLSARDQEMVSGCANLAQLNDWERWSFKRIAAFVRRNPAAVFSKPA